MLQNPAYSIMSRNPFPTNNTYALPFNPINSGAASGYSMFPAFNYAGGTGSTFGGFNPMFAANGSAFASTLGSSFSGSPFMNAPFTSGLPGYSPFAGSNPSMMGATGFNPYASAGGGLSGYSPFGGVNPSMMGSTGFNPYASAGGGLSGYSPFGGVNPSMMGSTGFNPYASMSSGSGNSSSNFLQTILLQLFSQLQNAGGSSTQNNTPTYTPNYQQPSYDRPRYDNNNYQPRYTHNDQNRNYNFNNNATHNNYGDDSHVMNNWIFNPDDLNIADENNGTQFNGTYNRGGHNDNNGHGIYCPPGHTPTEPRPFPLPRPTPDHNPRPFPLPRPRPIDNTPRPFPLPRPMPPIEDCPPIRITPGLDPHRPKLPNQVWGDPHVVYQDDKGVTHKYDFQGKPDQWFNAIQDGNLTANAHFTPYGGNNDVTVMDKAALDINGHKVAVDVNGKNTLNGEEIKAGQTYSFASGITGADGKILDASVAQDDKGVVHVNTGEYMLDLTKVTDPKGNYLNIDAGTTEAGSYANGKTPDGFLGPVFDPKFANFGKDGKLGAGAQGEGFLDKKVDDYKVADGFSKPGYTGKDVTPELGVLANKTAATATAPPPAAKK